MTKYAYAVLDREGVPLEVERVEIAKEGTKTVTLVRRGGAAFGGKRVIPIELVNFSEKEALLKYGAALEKRRRRLERDLEVCWKRESETTVRLIEGAK